MSRYIFIFIATVCISSSSFAQLNIYFSLTPEENTKIEWSFPGASGAQTDQWSWTGNVSFPHFDATWSNIIFRPAPTPAVNFNRYLVTQHMLYFDSSGNAPGIGNFSHFTLRHNQIELQSSYHLDDEGNPRPVVVPSFSGSTEIQGDLVYNTVKVGKVASINGAGSLGEIWFHKRGIGIVIRLIGSATITKADGSQVALSEGDQVFLEDQIKTSSRSFVRVRCFEGSQIQVGPKSQFTIEEFSTKRVSKMILLEGKLDKSQFTKRKKTRPIIIKTKTAAFGVRGTEIELIINEVDGLETVTGSVTEGDADFIDLVTGEYVQLNDNSSSSITYPLDHGGTFATATNVNINWTFESDLSPNDIDVFRFEIPSSGLISLYSEGEIDTQGELYDANHTLLAADDNSHDEYNFKIVRHLPPGTYFLKIMGADSSIEGEYSAEITKPDQFSYYVSQLHYPDDPNTYYFGRDREPSADVNGNGISNGLTYALQPLGGSIERTSLIKSSTSMIGQESAILSKIPALAPNDVIYRVFANENLAPNNWIEIAKKVGNGEWSGSTSDLITQSPIVNNTIPTTFEYPNTFSNIGFMRMTIEIDTDGSESGDPTRLPANASELENGGIFYAQMTDWILKFTITDLNNRKGRIEIEDSVMHNISFSYKENGAALLTLTDERLPLSTVADDLNTLLGEGGAAKDELDALLAGSEGALRDLKNVINQIKETNDFIVDSDDQDRIFVTRDIIISDNDLFSLSGTLLAGEAHPFDLEGETITSEPSIRSVMYISP